MDVLFDKTIFTFSTLETEPFIQAASCDLALHYQRDGKIAEDYFYALAIRLSELNVQQGHGGPFGAILVAFEGGIDDGHGLGEPKVVGVGANHVIPWHDPSAHAEMVAIQDAAHRQGYSDLSQTILYSSCECCPMCLSTAMASGITKIGYVNTRHQAAAIDFSDQLQYDLFKWQPEHHMMALATLTPTEQKNYLVKLGSYDAVVLDDNQEVFAQGKEDTTVDPTNIASINVIRTSVKKYADWQRRLGNPHPVCWLPENFTLISRYKPHPAGLIAADWARLLRQRDPEFPSNPAYDQPLPDPRRLVYVDDVFESMVVFTPQQHRHEPLKPEILFQILSQYSENNPILIERCSNLPMREQAKAVFTTWRDQIDQGGKIRY